MLQVKQLNIVGTTNSGSHRILQDVSFSFPTSRVIGIAGPSGAGKTLLSLGITGMIRYVKSIQFSGTVEWDGRNIHTLPDTQFRNDFSPEVSFIWQQPASAFNPALTIKQQWRLISRHLPDPSASSQRLDTELAATGLSDPHNVLSAYPFQLSTGQLQRVWIAMALARGPRIIVSDEATASLDTQTASIVLQRIKAYQSSASCTWLMITHRLSHIEHYADSVLHVNQGNVSTFDTASSFLASQRFCLPTIQSKLVRTSPPEEIPARPFVTLNNLAFSYKQKRNFLLSAQAVSILENISIVLHKHRFYGLTGPSGCGKSTLARIIAGLLTPASGQLTWSDTALDRKNGDIQMVFQDALLSLDPSMKVIDQLKEVIKHINPNIPIAEKNEWLSQLITLSGMRHDDLHRLPITFSGGQLQRIIFIRALLSRPRCIIFDETFSALDDQTKNEMVSLAFKLHEVHPYTAIWISHDQEILLDICDEVYVIRNKTTQRIFKEIN